MESILSFLQGAGILTILLFCFIIAASIETGRENDACRARAEKGSNESRGDDRALPEHSAIAISNMAELQPDQYPERNSDQHLDQHPDHPGASIDVTR